MGPRQSVTTCLRKSFQFSGRASRSEYWWFALAWIISPEIVGFLVAFPFGVIHGFKVARGLTDIPLPVPTLAIRATQDLWILMSVPALSVTIRRLNDIGRKWFWIALVPATAILLPVAIIGARGILEYPDNPGFSSWFGELAGANWRYSLMISCLPLMALLFRPSKPGPNKYGPNPYEVTP